MSTVEYTLYFTLSPQHSGYKVLWYKYLRLITGAIIIAGDSSIKLQVQLPSPITCIRLYEIYGFELYINRCTGNLSRSTLQLIEI